MKKINNLASPLLTLTLSVSLLAPTASLSEGQSDTSPKAISKSIVDVSGGELEAVRQIITEDLKDPSSAELRNVKGQKVVFDDGSAALLACGEVNAKNVYGGYVGFRRFAAVVTNGTGGLHGIDDGSDPLTEMLLQKCSDLGI